MSSTSKTVKTAQEQSHNPLSTIASLLTTTSKQETTTSR